MAGRARVAQPLRPLDDPDDEWAALRAQFLPTPVKQEQVTPEKYRQAEPDAEESEGTASCSPQALRPTLAGGLLLFLLRAAHREQRAEMDFHRQRRTTKSANRTRTRR